jgi:hypothetical protein
MSAITIPKRVHTALLCAGLIAANGVFAEDCPQKAGAANAHQPVGEGADTGSISVGDRPRARSAAELYELFHAPDLNKPDGLGDYVQNFQPTDPR